ncbi:MAG: hypothetical protein R2769_01430 [Saprospiraceae bacterium]
MKNEVSQDTLEILYSVRESIKKIRDPRVFPHEQIEVKTLNNNQQSLSTSQVIHYRINNEMEKLNKLSSLKFKYMAVVSPESEKEFGSIFKIINSIGFNAQMVDELRAARTPGKFGDDNSLLERLERSEEIIWHMEGDKIEKDINQLISKFERRQVELNKKTFYSSLALNFLLKSSIPKTSKINTWTLNLKLHLPYPIILDSWLRVLHEKFHLSKI